MNLPSKYSFKFNFLLQHMLPSRRFNPFFFAMLHNEIAGRQMVLMYRTFTADFL